MSWTVVADLAAAVCILLGALLALVAAIGVVRMPDLLSRMHAATKPQVLGTVLVMTGVALRLREPGVVGVLVLIVLLQMATSVVSSHMVGRASFRAGQVRRDLLVVDELSDGPAHEEPRGAP
ncbi:MULTISPECIES: monovalent cation/H(+) antiporter subunit G [Nocardioides]|jgi:multicomponent Na+:H+ antiporter subunit G|uniref:Monovalent cation/H(+) antiporter subunit G n=1 Tax=Nocardioides pinisoli TaxID=2950279 RepID=A0ABT1L488_9ACTN|nr:MULTISPECIES: monovalent cation/H(+) antiporter subunit G [Nocardioides]MCP3423801.1 monovalent cation/H(+) antiporter subunit G [Nocardioides pinisoli]NPC44541.1 monovalent cation/H(+) antiporter subunit G [Nocardioides sp. zg-1230]